MKTREREQAQILRRDRGLSVKEIARVLGVSRSSASLWVRNIELTEEQRDALRRGNPLVNAQMRGAAANAARWRARRQSYQDEGRALARGGDPFHAAGCMLFWAEGSRQRNVVIFSNSDPRMARFFLEFLRAYFGVSDEAVRVTCHLFADHEERQRESSSGSIRSGSHRRACASRS